MEKEIAEMTSEVAVKKLADEFATWPIDEKQLQHINDLRGKFDDLLGHISAVTKPSNGRYLAIVKTKLEEALMFTVKGISKP